MSQNDGTLGEEAKVSDVATAASAALSEALHAILTEFAAGPMDVGAVAAFEERIRAAVQPFVDGLGRSLNEDEVLRRRAEMYGTPARMMIVRTVADAMRFQQEEGAVAAGDAAGVAEARRAMGRLLREGAMEAGIERAALDRARQQAAATAGARRRAVAAAATTSSSSSSSSAPCETCRPSSLFLMASGALGPFGVPRAGAEEPTEPTEPAEPAVPPTPSPDETLPVFPSLNGWLRVDDPAAFGSDWHVYLGWPDPSQYSYEEWQLQPGMYSLYVRMTPDSAIMDGLNQPVLLASGVWATEQGREILAMAVANDVLCSKEIYSPNASYAGGTNEMTYTSSYTVTQGQDCSAGFIRSLLDETLCEPVNTVEGTEELAEYWREAGQETIPPHCAESSVMSNYAFPICDFYEGKGNVYLAECDCIKSGVLPGSSRIHASCTDLGSPSVDCEKLAAGSTEEMGKLVALRDARTGPIVTNLAQRKLVRSLRGLQGMQGTFPACVYPPCASLNSATAYTDARITRSERNRCPPVRCEASINVSWVGGNVNIEGNALRVNCFGGECMAQNGAPKCMNDGRCMVDGTCNCEGTGHHGDRCEINDETGEVTSGGEAPSSTTTTDPGHDEQDEEEAESQRSANPFDAEGPLHLGKDQLMDPELILRGAIYAAAVVGAVILLAAIAHVFRRRG
jgi:hypothetical protein